MRAFDLLLRCLLYVYFLLCQISVSLGQCTEINDYEDDFWVIRGKLLDNTSKKVLNLNDTSKIKNCQFVIQGRYIGKIIQDTLFQITLPKEKFSLGDKVEIWFSSDNYIIKDIKDFYHEIQDSNFLALEVKIRGIANYRSIKGQIEGITHKGIDTLRVVKISCKQCEEKYYTLSDKTTGRFDLKIYLPVINNKLPFDLEYFLDYDYKPFYQSIWMPSSDTTLAIVQLEHNINLKRWDTEKLKFEERSKSFFDKLKENLKNDIQKAIKNTLYPLDSVEFYCGQNKLDPYKMNGIKANFDSLYKFNVEFEAEGFYKAIVEFENDPSSNDESKYKIKSMEVIMSIDTNLDFDRQIKIKFDLLKIICVDPNTPQN